MIYEKVGKVCGKVGKVYVQKWKLNTYKETLFMGTGHINRNGGSRNVTLNKYVTNVTCKYVRKP